MMCNPTNPTVTKQEERLRALQSQFGPRRCECGGVMVAVVESETFTGLFGEIQTSFVETCERCSRCGKEMI